MANELKLLCIGTDGILVTDGTDLYILWEGKLGGKYTWSGRKAKKVEDAFRWTYQDVCGAEVDMRNTDDDPFTSEVLELADRVAEMINGALEAERKRVSAEWEKMRSGT